METELKVINSLICSFALVCVKSGFDRSVFAANMIHFYVAIILYTAQVLYVYLKPVFKAIKTAFCHIRVQA